MNDKITISTAELFRMFPDQETARTYLESRLWPNGSRRKKKIQKRESSI